MEIVFVALFFSHFSKKHPEVLPIELVLIFVTLLFSFFELFWIGVYFSLDGLKYMPADVLLLPSFHFSFLF